MSENESGMFSEGRRTLLGIGLKLKPQSVVCYQAPHADAGRDTSLPNNSAILDNFVQYHPEPALGSLHSPEGP